MLSLPKAVWRASQCSPVLFSIWIKGASLEFKSCFIALHFLFFLCLSALLKAPGLTALAEGLSLVDCGDFQQRNNSPGVQGGMCLCFLCTISWVEAHWGVWLGGGIFHWELKPGHSSFLNLETKLNFRKDLCWREGSLVFGFVMPWLCWLPPAWLRCWQYSQTCSGHLKCPFSEIFLSQHETPLCTAELDCVCCLWPGVITLLQASAF